MTTNADALAKIQAYIAAIAAGSAIIGKVILTDGIDDLAIDTTSKAARVTLYDTAGAAIATLPVSIATAPALVAGSAKIGDVALATRTSGSGLAVYRTIDLDESEEEVKATAGQLYGYRFNNLAATTRYIKFYNDTAANVIVGTTAPLFTEALEADQGDVVMFSVGLPFTALCIAATTGVADNDTGAPGANDVVGYVLYA